MREFLDLANNPLFVKHVRSRLRRAALIPGLLVTALIGIGIIVLHERVFMDPQRPEPIIASVMFSVLQGLILFLMGGSQVASAASHINESGLIDMHRITPMPSKVQTLGLLLGAPIRELLLYTATLPFSMYVALSGSGTIGITAWCKLLLVQLGAALLYWTVAMVAGISAKTGRGASGRYVALLAVLNIMANNLYPLGISGPALLTVVPIYLEVFEDNNAAQQNQAAMQNAQQVAGPKGAKQVGPPGAKQVGPPAMQQGQPQQAQRRRGQPGQQAKPEVTFYSASVPLVLQSLLFQGTFLAFLFIAASRRMRSARLPLYSKPVALLFFASISVLTLGNAWDTAKMLRILGIVYFLTMCGIMLTTSITPLKGDVVKGMQRARKMSGSHVPPWSDLSTNKLVVLLFGAILGATTALAILLAPDPPLPAFIQLQNVFQPWPPLAVGVATLFFFGFALQYLNLTMDRRGGVFIAGLIVFLWVLPLTAGGLISGADEEAGTIIMAVSPITGILNAGAVSIGAVAPSTVQIAAIAPSAIFALMFIGLLLGAERKSGSLVHAEHAEQPPPKGLEHEPLA
jgi:hypothetical protein